MVTPTFFLMRKIEHIAKMTKHLKDSAQRRNNEDRTREGPGRDWEAFMDSMEKAIEEASRQSKEEETRLAPKSIKLLPFWTKTPGTWFYDIEFIFNITGVMDSVTKFNYVVISLDSSTIIKIQEVWNKPDEADRYNQIKTTLLEILKNQTPRNKNGETSGDGVASFKQFMKILRRFTNDKYN